MIKLNLPEYEYKLKRIDDTVYIWDTLRQKYITLTPEEWVRQHFTAYLVAHCGYPHGRMGNEISITQNGISRRCDTLVYDKEGAVVMIIEYKAPHVALTQKVFDQTVRYNMSLQVPYIVVSNGLVHYCCHIDYATRACTFVKEIPSYEVICSCK